MKAISLFSGGLDSQLAVCLVKQQGIDVVGVNLISPFLAETVNWQLPPMNWGLSSRPWISPKSTCMCLRIHDTATESI